MFTVFPAIDLKGGEVVRLAEGDMRRATVYGQDPAAQAARFAADGAGWLHVVDLDGAFAGGGRNSGAVEAILKATPARVQVGGGIRARESIDRWLALGVARVVIGTAALTDPQLVRESAAAYPGQVVVAVDARGGFVATGGWAEVSQVPVAELGQRFEDAGVAALLFTDVARDGMLRGVNAEATAALADAVRIPVIASGGLAALGEIADLRRHPNIAGVIAGRALYDGRISLPDALAAAA